MITTSTCFPTPACQWLPKYPPKRKWPFPPSGSSSGNGKAAAQARGIGSLALPPAWQPHLCSYNEKRLLRFKTDEDLGAAIDLLWSDELLTLPDDNPDGRSIIVPAEAVSYFSRAGLKFADEKMRSISDLRPEEIAQLRRG